MNLTKIFANFLYWRGTKRNQAFEREQCKDLFRVYV